MKKSWLHLAAIALIAASCSSGEENFSQNPTDAPIKVNASVNPLSTRAGYTTDDLPSQFNLKLKAATEEYSYDVVMKPVEEDNTTKWKGFDPSAIETEVILRWADDVTPVDVKTSNFEISDNAVSLSAATDQTTTDGLKSCDFLMWDNPAQKPDIYNGIDVAFSHVMAKLNILVTLGNQFNYESNPIKEVIVCGTKVTGNFDRAQGWSFADDAKTDNVKAFYTEKSYKAIDADNANATAQYEVILVPQTLAKDVFKIQVVIGDDTYTWTSAEEVKIEKGSCHQLKLKAGKNKVEKVDFTPMDWAESSYKVTTD